jgi:hypothetical protein
MHGENRICPPYNNYEATFKSQAPEPQKVGIKATDLAIAFEDEWVKRYPDMRHFTVDTAIRDIAHWRKVIIPPETFEGLVRFLTKYLKEHTDRFAFGGMGGFRVIKNTTPASQHSPN